ncbi:MAG: hypothetical protein ASARMPREDX12_000992 [Alectoria sarmentosa]|nr:MAG: hypothetical protein ASARMPREDX12_000992 [Alectoria sarmentosa]
MASTVYGYGRTVTSCDGLEVDPSATGPSAPGLHQLPESQGIEATPGELGPSPGPQTLPIPQKELALDRATTAQFQLASSSDLKIPSGSRSSPKSKRLLPLVMAVIIVAVIVLALAIPLAVRLKKPSKPSSPVNSNSTTRISTELPTSEAFNGTALAFTSVDITSVPDLSLFYQDYNSSIHRLYSIELSSFTGGFPIVASNARNATPVTTLTYPTNNGALNSHLYYIDIDDTLQELYSTDNLLTWQLGSLGDCNITASVSSTALTAFFSDHWLGQDGNSTGIRLYYGAPDNQIRELALFPNVGSRYFSQFIFSGTNGNAGFSSAWWDGPGLGNLYLFDEKTIFKYGPITSTTPTTPLSLHQTTEANYSVKANTALSFGAVGTASTSPNPARDQLCFQQTSSEIKCSPISPSDGTLLPPSDVSDTEPAPAVPGFQIPQPGSALLAAWLPTPGTFPWELNIFYQIDSGDLIQYADATGTWVNTTLPTR